MRLFHEKLIAYDFGPLGLVLFSASKYHFQPFFSQKFIASVLSPNSIFMFDNGSPLKQNLKTNIIVSVTKRKNERINKFKKKCTNVDVQPINGFSQRSLLSNSMTQLWVLSVPDCMTFLVVLLIFTRRVLTCSSGTPVTALRSTWITTETDD